MTGLPTPTPSVWRGKRSSIPRFGALLSVVLLMIAACSNAGAPATNAPAATTAPPATPTATATAAPTASPTIAPTASATPSAATPSAATAAFPVTVTDDESTAVTIPAEPQHIVSLSPANTEILFALGSGDHVVGGTDADDYPAEARALPDVATFTGVQIERVLDLKTDLVIAAGNNFTPPADIKRLRDLGIPVVVVYAQTVDQVLSDIRLIGQAVGAAPKAAELTDTMRRRMDTISAAAAQGVALRVFYQIGSAPDIYGPADDSFVADIIELAGGKAITTGDKVSFTMPLERLVAADPEVIIVGDANYGVSAADVEARGGAWASMTAVKDHQVRPVDDIIVTRPGPRLADGLAALAWAIDPALVIPGETPAPVAPPSPSAPASSSPSTAPTPMPTPSGPYAT